MEEGRSATSVISRKEGRVAEDFGDRDRVPAGICIDHRGGNIARGVGDGAAFLVCGRYIHRRV